jgi:lipoprotein signal peptidase
LEPKPGYISGVVDFVECIWFGWEQFENIPILSFLSWQTWPTFNLADSLIVIGITLLFFQMIQEEWIKQKKE